VTVAAGNAPPVIEALAVTPAPALPAPAALPLVSRIHERRATLRGAAHLGDVVSTELSRALRDLRLYEKALA
jgi:hypothetical protein